MASRPKVTSWFKMAARAPHDLPVLSGRKEKKPKRDALTSLLQHIPEVASAYILLAKLSHMAIPYLAANRGWGLCGLHSGRGAHVQLNTGDFMSTGEEEGGYLRQLVGSGCVPTTKLLRTVQTAREGRGCVWTARHLGCPASLWKSSLTSTPQLGSLRTGCSCYLRAFWPCLRSP